VKRPAGRVFAALLAAAVACDASPGVDPIFVEGRAVAPAGDSLIALTFSGRPEVLVRRRARLADARTLGRGTLHSPAHVQWLNGEWFVSDVDNGRPVLVVFGADGQLRRRIDAGRHTATPHQFAVLPDGRVVVEGTPGTLIVLAGDSVATFAITGQSGKTGLLLAASGGVLHAVPDKYLTLYNEFGRIRWRQDWPWASTAYIADLAVDPSGRIHAIAGVPSSGTFVVYTLSNQSGEVTRWSEPGPVATFVVEPLGEIRPDDAKRWTQ
jgi:hypothetical protein